jgi:protein-L-isoaspartate(D-aspartate) O-methyltransferase
MIRKPGSRGGGSPGDDTADEGRVGDPYLEDRLRMVHEQIRRRDVKDPRVLRAMEKVPRHLFVRPEDIPFAHTDSPLPIGHGQTISQPYIVALMTELLEIEPDHRVLEIGTGSGYQAAVLSLLAKDVYTVEYLEPLAASARKLLASLGCANVHVRVGDGYEGWKEEAPFDSIIVTAAPESVPDALSAQLKEGGRMAIPVGSYFQDLVLAVKKAGRLREQKVADVRFVPMVRRCR